MDEPAGALTFDDAANLYDEHHPRGSRRARTLPMDHVVKWLLGRKDLCHETPDGYIVRGRKPRKTRPKEV